MDKNLEKALFEKYPIILRDMYGDKTKTCLTWGIECGDGWYNLLDNLLKFLQWHANKNNYPQVVATQIKEKFGTLSFYFKYDSESFQSSNGKSEYIEGAIAFAERMSSQICEVCGKPGKIERVNGWFSCKCDECRK